MGRGRGGEDGGRRGEDGEEEVRLEGGGERRGDVMVRRREMEMEMGDGRE